MRYTGLFLFLQYTRDLERVILNLKILRLYLKNFAHILSGVGKYEIDLDFRDTHKTINVLVGKMGSGKTAILGHLQPLAAFGSLDVRNEDEFIIPGKDGLKILELQAGSDYYEIRHQYIWKEDKKAAREDGDTSPIGHHVTKSFIYRNEEDLNPSGSVTQFKSIVETELGFDQTVLSLIRLGPNVKNIIDMRAAERKNVMSMLVSDADRYQVLYKKLGEDVRAKNAQIALVMRKISNLSTTSKDEMMTSLRDRKERIEDYTSMRDQAQKKVYEIQAYINAALNGLSEDAFRREIKMHESELIGLSAEIRQMNDDLSRAKSLNMSITDIAKQIGSIESTLNSNQQMKIALNDEYTKVQDQLRQYIDQQKMVGDASQLDRLKKSYAEVMSQIADIEDRIKGFECKYNSSMIQSFLETIKSINAIIEKLNDYDQHVVLDILKKGSLAIQYADKQTKTLKNKRLKYEQAINNFRFAQKYVVPEGLKIPVGCPDHKCPYITTHPATLQKDISMQEEQKIKEYNDKIADADAQIDKFSEYPIIYTHLRSLQSLWSPMVHKLEELGVLKTGSLIKVFSVVTYQVWYDNDALIETLEKCKYRELYYELMERSSALKTELAKYAQYDMEEIQNTIDHYREQSEGIVHTLSNIEASSKKLIDQKAELEQDYLKLAALADQEKALNDKIEKQEKIQDIVDDMYEKLEVIHDRKRDIDEYNHQIDGFNEKLKLAQMDFNSLQARLNDISYAQKEYDELVQEQEILKYILDAASPSRGIPLVYVQIFLRECKEILNDLIADVFGDSIEILDFIINENEFRIPYAINGCPVDDVSRASQGQKSIISLALSFALMRQSNSRWNIMLLDEVDGPLHRNDRNKFISILYKQLAAIDANQVFLISHNFTFEGQDVNVIMTTDEHIERTPMMTVMRV